MSILPRLFKRRESLPLEEWLRARLADCESFHINEKMRNIGCGRVLRIFEELAVTLEGKAL